MTSMVEGSTTAPGGIRLSPGLWLATVAELAVAVAVGAVLLRANATSMPAHHHQHEPGMHDSSMPIHWSVSFFTIAALTAALSLGWKIFRNRVFAFAAPGGLIAVVASEPVRTLALQSHLIAMAIVEVVLVAAPLLIVAGVRGRTDQQAGRSSGWMAGVIAAVLANSTLLIVLHLPAIHGRAAALTAVPGWLITAAVVIGVGYWSAILLTAGSVPLALRRAALTIGQEVAAILGLAAIIVPASHTHQVNPLGLSAATDQRLGGVLMLITCAVVTLPLMKRLAKSPAFRMEPHVH
ncbi:hypothetical protein [Mycolicibacter sinensis]|uniref:Uncharacterized protein n=1 Tax=Mycolicibacter sinensis (strain JDM601) TaxID=875328 RepID=A0A1A2EBM7_MYCSD|nr:hypothetical protein [Mycolicibacter sinensis]OBG02567.1 hypothetical protein A5772_07525 [Mycolicibacter sinensis]OBG03063.1 hypothetical protein A5771_14040 [Mycolicibacter sinensis]